DDEIYFRIELMDGNDDDDFAGDADSLVLGCDQVGTQQIRLWVIDENGSFDYCDVLLIVQNNMDGCPEDDTPGIEGIILGNIATEAGTMIEQVEVMVSGENVAASISTGADGAYNFDIPMGTLINIEPRKDINDINGVSTMDLILLQKHLTGMETLPTPYRMIAADVNHDGFLNSLDLLQMRQLIIGEISEFPNNTSWRFVLADHDFSTNDPQSESFPERFTVSMDQTMMRQDFIGMKVGDLDLDSDVALGAPRTNGQRQLLEIEERSLETGEIVEIPVYLKNSKDLIAVQYTMHFDPASLKLLNIIPNGALDVDEHHFGMKRIEQGILTTAFDATEAISGEMNQLLVLQVEVTRPGKISDLISINGSITAPIAYYDDGIKGDVALQFSKRELDRVKLYQNEPNPATSETAIKFYLPEAANADLIFYDVDGKILKKISGNFIKGINKLNLAISEFEKRGVIYYELNTINGKVGRKMIIQ
ncbi:MAG: T9SS type A sorting domain-containing protein, partial [Saprospiraceae bacterium]|nr:T9SS type A sorting domain-containing protein [Saprospiraceae bacterium]